MNVAFEAKEWITAHTLKRFRGKPPALREHASPVCKSGPVIAGQGTSLFDTHATTALARFAYRGARKRASKPDLPRNLFVSF